MTLEQSLSGYIDRIDSRIRDLEITAAKQQAVIEMALADAKQLAHKAAEIAEKASKDSQKMQGIAISLILGNMGILALVLAAAVHII